MKSWDYENYSHDAVRFGIPSLVGAHRRHWRRRLLLEIQVLSSLLVLQASLLLAAVSFTSSAGGFPRKFEHFGAAHFSDPDRDSDGNLIGDIWGLTLSDQWIPRNQMGYSQECL